MRQGDNLSPYLFKLFHNDLHSCFDTSDDQVVLRNIRFSCLTNADDLVLLSTTATGLQKCLDKVSAYCDANGLTVNLKKNKIVTFSKSGRESKTPFLFNTVDSNPWVSCFHHLVLFHTVKVICIKGG